MHTVMNVVSFTVCTFSVLAQSVIRTHPMASSNALETKLRVIFQGTFDLRMIMIMPFAMTIKFMPQHMNPAKQESCRSMQWTFRSM